MLYYTVILRQSFPMSRFADDSLCGHKVNFITAI